MKKTNKGKLRRVSISYNETGTLKSCAQVLCGTASAPFVFALGIRAQENSLSPHPRPLSTGVLARTTGELLKYHASASEKSQGVNGTGDFTAT